VARAGAAAAAGVGACLHAGRGAARAPLLAACCRRGGAAAPAAPFPNLNLPNSQPPSPPAARPQEDVDPGEGDPAQLSNPPGVPDQWRNGWRTSSGAGGGGAPAGSSGGGTGPVGSSGGGAGGGGPHGAGPPARMGSQDLSASRVRPSRQRRGWGAHGASQQAAVHAPAVAGPLRPHHAGSAPAAPSPLMRCPRPRPPLRLQHDTRVPVDILCPLPPADRSNFAAMDVLRNTALHVPQGGPPQLGGPGAPPHAKVTLATTADKLADTGKV
jgi:hypothetical protein